jgi:hypothetical protein
MRNQDGTIQRNRQTHWVHKTKPNAQSRWDNPEKPANTLGTQDTDRRQTKQKTQHRKLKR